MTSSRYRKTLTAKSLVLLMVIAPILPLSDELAIDGAELGIMEGRSDTGSGAYLDVWPNMDPIDWQFNNTAGAANITIDAFGLSIGTNYSLDWEVWDNESTNKLSWDGWNWIANQNSETHHAELANLSTGCYEFVAKLFDEDSGTEIDHTSNNFSVDTALDSCEYNSPPGWPENTTKFVYIKTENSTSDQHTPFTLHFSAPPMSDNSPYSMTQFCHTESGDAVDAWESFVPTNFNSITSWSVENSYGIQRGQFVSYDLLGASSLSSPMVVFEQNISHSGHAPSTLVDSEFFPCDTGDYTSTSGSNGSNGSNGTDQVKIGLLADQTGPISAYYPGFQAAAELAIADLNSMTSAYNFTLEEEDSGCDSTTSSASAQELVDDSVIAVAGAACSGASMGANAVLSAAGIPMVSFASSSRDLSNDSQYPLFFRVVPVDGLEGEALYDIVNDAGHSSPAIVAVDTNYGNGISDAFEAEWGATCSDSSFYESDSDFSSIANAINAAGCDSIVLVTPFSSSAADFLDDLYASYDNAANSWIIPPVYATPNIYVAESNNPCTHLTTAPCTIMQNVTFLQHDDYESSMSTEFWHDCNNDSDCASAIYQAEAYDAVRLIGESYISMHNDGHADIEEAIFATGDDWHGASSMIDFDASGDVDGGGYGICTQSAYGNYSLDCHDDWSWEGAGSPPDVNIGLLADESGPISSYYAGWQAAAEIAIADLNSMTSAYNFALKEEDTGCDSTTSAASAQELVDDSVIAVAGAACSGASMGANGVLSAAGIPMVSFASTSSALSDDSAYPMFFRLVQFDGLEAKPLFDLVSEAGHSSPALVYVNNAYGISVADMFIDGWGTPCTNSHYEVGSGSFYEIANAINAAGCDSIVLVAPWQDGPDMVADFLDELYIQNSSNIPPIYATLNTYESETDNPCTELMYASCSIMGNVTFLQPDNYESSMSTEFWHDCNNDSDCASTANFQDEVYDAVRLIGESYIAMHNDGHAGIEEAIFATGDNWHGASSLVNFSDGGDSDAGGYEICKQNYWNNTLDCFDDWSWATSSGSGGGNESGGGGADASGPGVGIIGYETGNFSQSCNPGDSGCPLSIGVLEYGHVNITIGAWGLGNHNASLQVNSWVDGMSTNSFTVEVSGTEEMDVTLSFWTDEYTCSVSIQAHLHHQSSNGTTDHYGWNQSWEVCDYDPSNQSFDPILNLSLPNGSAIGSTMPSGNNTISSNIGNLTGGEHYYVHFQAIVDGYWQVEEGFWFYADNSSKSFDWSIHLDDYDCQVNMTLQLSDWNGNYAFVQHNASAPCQDPPAPYVELSGNATNLSDPMPAGWHDIHVTGHNLTAGESYLVNLQVVVDGQYWLDESYWYSAYNSTYWFTGWSVELDEYVCSVNISASLSDYFGNYDAAYHNASGECQDPPMPYLSISNASDPMSAGWHNISVNAHNLTEGDDYLVGFQVTVDGFLVDGYSYWFTAWDSDAYGVHYIWLDLDEYVCSVNISATMMDGWGAESPSIHHNASGECQDPPVPYIELSYANGSSLGTFMGMGWHNASVFLGNLTEGENYFVSYQVSDNGTFLDSGNFPLSADGPSFTFEWGIWVSEFDCDLNISVSLSDYWGNQVSTEHHAIAPCVPYETGTGSGTGGGGTGPSGPPHISNVQIGGYDVWGLSIMESGLTLNASPYWVDVHATNLSENASYVAVTVVSIDGFEIYNYSTTSYWIWNHSTYFYMPGEFTVAVSSCSITIDTYLLNNSDPSSSGTDSGSNSSDFGELLDMVSSTLSGPCDLDSDNDGVGDDSDAFPLDPSETTDSDGDGIGDNSDDFPFDANETTDSDGDGIGDNEDTDVDGDGVDDDQDDSDGDGVTDDIDAFPFDANETTDTDGDGVGDNSDAFPNDANETTDTDGDGIGDNSDPDSDGDGTPNGLDDFPLNSALTSDSDRDGVQDADDAFPNDPTEYIDTDGDGVGNNADGDDDGDGTPDDIDDMPLNPNEQKDTDRDGIGDNADAFPNDPQERHDSDGDGVGDNSDDFPSDPMEWSDKDNDGFGDNSDAFPNDPNEYADSDGDGVGNNADDCDYDASGSVDADNDGVCEDGQSQSGSSNTDDEGGDAASLPGFTSSLVITSILGAAIVANRRRE